MTYRDRREARAERLDEWAAKREAKSLQAANAADRIADAIPFGQPILIGHHSEAAHRRDIERMHSGMDKAVEHERKAESMSARADGIRSQLANAIYSDDADAIPALEARIAKLEAERETYKAANASYRKAHKAELAAMTPYERGQAVPYPSYAITNVGANIRRNVERLELLKIDAERVARAEAAGGREVRHLKNGYCVVTFVEKPADDVLEALRAGGYRWQRVSWVGEATKLPEIVKDASRSRSQ